MSTSLAFVGAVLLMLVAAVWVGLLVAGTPPLIIAAAVLPATVYATVTLLGQRGEGRPALPLFVSVFWGMTGAAFVSHSMNELARVWIAVLAGPRARELTATLAAPAIEEAAKAAGLLILLLRRNSIEGVRDGIVYGALIGIGFVVTENLVYLAFAVLQGGELGLVQGVYLRGVLAGGVHAVFTATVGAGVGWARAAIAERERILAPAAAFAAAVAQHLAWNLLASTVITGALCGAETVGGACRPAPTPTDLFIVVPLVAVTFLGPGAAALLFMYNREVPRTVR